MAMFRDSDAQTIPMALVGLVFVLVGVLGLVAAGDIKGLVVSLIILFIGLLLIPGVGPIVGNATAKGFGLIFTGPGLLVMIAFLVMLAVVLHSLGYW